MSAKFVVQHLEEQIGPFTEEELIAKWSAGELLPIDYVYDEAKSDWVLLADRFLWAKPKKQEAAVPPPIKDETIKRRRPPEGALTLGKPLPPIIVTGAEPQPKPATPPAPIEVPTLNPTPAAAALRTLTEEAFSPHHDSEFVTTKAESTSPTLVTKVEDLSSFNTAPIEITKLPHDEMTSPGHTGATIKLVDGQGVADLNDLRPGKVELVVQDPALSLTNKMTIDVKPMEPVEVRWTVSEHQTAGAEAMLRVQAVDDKGKPCLGFHEPFTLQIRGPVHQDVSVPVKDGVGSIALRHTKAETWDLRLHYAGTKSIRMPQGQSLEWRPGPATRLILDGPQEYVAGNPLKVQVKAVDEFGNLAKTYQGTVVLEIKAS